MTSAFLLFVAFELLRIAGILTNAYVGLVSYMALPAFFILGLVFIPLGWWQFRRASGRTMRDLLDERFPQEMTRPKRLGSSLVGMIAVLTLVNIMFLGLGGARMLHFMDGPEFCGTACHGVMEPEWMAYQNSPHAHVRCVDCHVGEGADALIDAKLNGLWQVVSATFDLYDRPIPTPVHQLRPARETCEKCHWPDKFYGERITTITKFAQDEASTPSYTTLALKVGSGSADMSGTIHWHIAAENEVRYEAADDARLTMRWVEVRRGDRYHRFTNRTLDAAPDVPGEPAAVRSMDCVDCHNRATHIYQDPEAAVDQALAAGRLSRELPYAKRTALAALLGSWSDKESALQGIESTVRGTYARTPGAGIGMLREADAMTAELQAIYARNVFPHMNVTWNTYVSHLGHKGKGGCFRCHNADMVDETGQAVPYDCTLCHSILALDSATPFRFLQPIEANDPERQMHRYLQAEFLGVPVPDVADSAAAAARAGVTP
ncbi:MAG TPA: NapC/NirT family cytochrome c [Candidatus Krumholzibacteria bacterium]|nr:NapC/NirT family cytochrome c [Candidatus Krumholzibacteria bacterium]